MNEIEQLYARFKSGEKLTIDELGQLLTYAEHKPVTDAKAFLSITRCEVYGTASKSFIQIEIKDANYAILMRVRVGKTEFANALTGIGDVNCELDRA